MAVSKSKGTSRVANPIETATGAGSNFAAQEFSQSIKTIKSQFEGTTDDFFSQLLGIETPGSKSAKSGEMKPGEAISFGKKSQETKQQPKPERKPAVRAAIEYHTEIARSSEQLSRVEARELGDRVNQIMDELKRLVDSSSILRSEFVEVSVQQKPTQVGKYHLNFFEWLLIEIRKIRQKVEDSGAWLGVMKSKKSQRNYGNMAKKHGTTFTLSNERTAATQTG